MCQYWLTIAVTNMMPRAFKHVARHAAALRGQRRLPFNDASTERRSVDTDTRRMVVRFAASQREHRKRRRGESMKRQFGLVTILAMIATFVFGSAGTVGAAGTTVVVTPTNTQGWSTADTRPGGAVNFVADATAPAGAGALQLTTDATTTSKAQYMHAANTPLSFGHGVELLHQAGECAIPRCRSFVSAARSS